MTSSPQAVGWRQEGNISNATALHCVRCGPFALGVRGLVTSLVSVVLYVTANAASAEEPLKLANTQLEPVKWTELAGWTADDHLAAFAAYEKSCQALSKIRGTKSTD
jgi:hypothetical protein